MKQWNEIFKKEGKVFTKVQEDVPKIATVFKKHNIRKILDLGCGSGRHIIYFAKRGFDVYGIDIAEEGISITKSWLKKENFKADLKIGNIYDKLPYPDDFFDAVVSIYTIHHSRIENIRKAIQEVERVLKPEGLIFIISRKRKLRKQRLKSKIIERFRKQKVAYKVIGPKTYVPIEGGEKGLIHYLFNKESLRKEFKNFKIYNIWVTSNKRQYCLLGE
ncbi:MAG: class I SAM-dependent methyltransferase, partial [Candidatus Firestonebacteria bacterium]